MDDWLQKGLIIMLLENLCEQDKADFLITECGNMVGITYNSRKGRAAIAAGKIAFENWQVMGGQIMVDQRMAGDLVTHLQEDGYAIALVD